jgi:hypothetical protein
VSWTTISGCIAQLRGALGDMRVAGQHHGDRLADMAHLVQRQDGLIVKRRAVIRFGDNFSNILAGDDAMDAGDFPRCAGINVADAAVRHRRPRDFAVEHAGQAQIVHVVGAAGDLGAHFEARNLSPDLLHRRLNARLRPVPAAPRGGCRP